MDEYTQGKQQHAAVSACTNKNYVSDTHSKRTKRQQEFLEPARPICHLCQGSHTHISSPREWKNVQAQRYVLSIGMSADSLVCRPCRQDVTRVVTDPGHTPRWGRDVGTKSKNLCSVLNCTIISFVVVSSTPCFSNKHGRFTILVGRIVEHSHFPLILGRPTKTSRPWTNISTAMDGASSSQALVLLSLTRTPDYNRCSRLL